MSYGIGVLDSKLVLARTVLEELLGCPMPGQLREVPRERQPQWGIWCRVTGGVTGTREAWAKQEGEPLLFPTEQLAAREAAHMQDRAGTAPSPTGAVFTYTPRRYE